MSRSQHNFTAGPWLRTGLTIKQDRGDRFGPVIARVAGPEVAIDAECEANANLIAAAPELLQALIMVRDADNDCRMDGMPTIPAVARYSIDRAIAKAEGGAA